MIGQEQMISHTLRRLFHADAGAERVDAVVRVTSYGAEVELANGSACTLLQRELVEPAIVVGVRWARTQGASTIRIRRS